MNLSMDASDCTFEALVAMKEKLIGRSPPVQAAQVSLDVARARTATAPLLWLECQGLSALNCEKPQPKNF